MADLEIPPGGQFGHVTLGVVLAGQLSAPVVLSSQLGHLQNLQFDSARNLIG